MQLNNSVFASTLLVIITISALNVEARHRRHHKRALVEDYDYRDSTDYTGEGVFVDSVPMKTTTESNHLREHQKTNRFPKLRRFYADNSDRFFH